MIAVFLPMCLLIYLLLLNIVIAIVDGKLYFPATIIDFLTNMYVCVCRVS